MNSNNKIFELAASFVRQTNRHVFLTGKAGTGKTTFLKYIQQHCGKKMAVVAPTGVAAINAGGVTIHSFFQLPLGTFIFNYRPDWGESESQIFNKNQLLGKLRLQQDKRILLKELELLVIDEVSMVRADVLDAIDTVLRSVRRCQHLPFGGVQVLFIGDLFQLPPVVRQQEQFLLNQVYKSPFFFDAMVIGDCDLVYVELKKIYRQHDDVFINILNNIRNCNVQQEDMELLHRHYKPNFNSSPSDELITLTSHNYQADTINKQELEKLSSKTFLIEAEIEKDFPENAYPAEKTLRLKEGAQIMFIRNDKNEIRRYYNGKIGTVERISQDGKEIFVRFKDEPELLTLEKETWKNIRYKYNPEDDDINEETLGTFTQYPIRLAWAVTIHKSQGLTFDKAIVDAGRSFAPGQVYVALSRLRSLEGLILRSRIGYDAIKTDARVLDFSKNEMNDGLLEQLLLQSQKKFLVDSLLQVFNMEKVDDYINTHIQNTRFNALPEGTEAEQFINQLASTIFSLQETAQKFQTQLQRHLQQNYEEVQQFHDRVKAAATWFDKNINELLIQPLQEHLSRMRVKQRTKQYVKATTALLHTIKYQNARIKQAAVVTEAWANHADWQQLMDGITIMNAPKIPADDSLAIKGDDITSTSTKGMTKHISFEMFQEGKSIETIAAERGLTMGTIVGHLLDWVEKGEIDIHVFVKEEKLPVILEVIQQNIEATSSQIKSLLGEDYSYPEIKATLSYWRFLVSKKTGNVQNKWSGNQP